jgi:hypothetical protein
VKEKEKGTEIEKVIHILYRERQREREAERERQRERAAFRF